MRLGDYVRTQPPQSSFVVQIGANTHEERADAVDSAVKLAISAGWRALLVEPAPQSFRTLTNHYQQMPRVRTAHAAVCATASGRKACEMPPRRFYSLDITNGTGTHGSDDADVRCTRGQFRSKSIWISQLASFSRTAVLHHQFLFENTSRECRRCTQRLKRPTPLPSNCLRNVLVKNLAPVLVPCLCFSREIRHAVTLLIIDTE